MSQNLNEIRVSERLDDAIAEGLREAEGIRKARARKRRLGTSGVFLSVLLLFFGVGVANPAFASDLPVIGQFFSYLQEQRGMTQKGNFGEKAVSYTELAAKGQKISAQDQGVTVTAKEAYCDGYTLYTAVEISFDDSVGEIAKYSGQDIVGLYAKPELVSVNGEFPATLQGVSADALATGIEGVQLSDNKVLGIVTLSLSDYTVPPLTGELRAAFRFSQIWADLQNGEQNADDILPQYQVEGDWNLEFTVPVTDQAPEISQPELIDPETGFGVHKLIRTENRIVLTCAMEGYDSDGYMTESYFEQHFSAPYENKEPPSYTEDMRKHPAELYLIAYDSQGNRYTEYEGTLQPGLGTTRCLMTGDREISELRLYFIKDDTTVWALADKGEDEVKEQAAASFTLELDE